MCQALEHAAEFFLCNQGEGEEEAEEAEEGKGKEVDSEAKGEDGVAPVAADQPSGNQ